MILTVGCRHYFLLSFIDVYCRYIVHHRLLSELNSRTVSVELEAAQQPGCYAYIWTDHGPKNPAD